MVEREEPQQQVEGGTGGRSWGGVEDMSLGPG